MFNKDEQVIQKSYLIYLILFFLLLNYLQAEHIFFSYWIIWITDLFLKNMVIIY